MAVTFVCTTGWLVLGQRLAEETGLRRQVWLANNFQGAPVIDDVARSATLDFLDDDPRLPREFISARWHGYWYVPSRQSFTLHVYADDYADIWIDREQRFARSSAAARGVRLDAGVHELQVVYQQYAGAAHLAFYEGSRDAYPLPLRTGHLFPSQPEPDVLRLATIVDRLWLTVVTLWATGALSAAIFILRRRRAARCLQGAGGTSAPTRLDAVALTVLCLTVLVYGYGNLSLRRSASADGLHNLTLGIRLAQDGTYLRWPRQVDEHQREPFGPSLIAITDLAAEALGFGVVPMECVSEGFALASSESCRRRYAPYRGVNLALLLFGALGVFWLVLRYTSKRSLAYVGFVATAQSAALLASAESFYTEVHAGTLMVAVGVLTAVTVSTRRLVHAALLGLTLAALVLTTVTFIYLWIPIALALAAADLLRRRLNWTTAGLVGVMLIAQGVPVVGWMTRNDWVSGDFAVVEARSADVLVRRESFNTMRHDESVAGFAYYLPTGANWWLEGTPRESFERFGSRTAHGFRGTALRLISTRRNELRKEGSAALTGLDEREELRRIDDEMAVEARARLLADPVQHFKVGLLLAWRGVFVEEGLGFLSDPLTQRLADIRGNTAWPRWRLAYGASAATLVNLVGVLALLVVPLWFWLGRGRFEAVFVFLPALYAHGAYSMASHFLPRYALPEIPLRITATMLLLYLAWSSLHRLIKPLARGGRPASIDQRAGTGERSIATR